MGGRGNGAGGAGGGGAGGGLINVSNIGKTELLPGPQSANPLLQRKKGVPVVEFKGETTDVFKTQYNVGIIVNKKGRISFTRDGEKEQGYTFKTAKDALRRLKDDYSEFADQALIPKSGGKGKLIKILNAIEKAIK